LVRGSRGPMAAFAIACGTRELRTRTNTSKFKGLFGRESPFANSPRARRAFRSTLAPSEPRTSLAPSSATRGRAVRLWLVAVAALMFVTVVVGGATRLTESGLSIVEWKPVTGVMPPLDAAAWQAEFGKYKTIPQYREHNAGMSLDEFKTIYWWEWTHRLLARLVCGSFLVPFLGVLWRGSVEPTRRRRVGADFGPGAALG